MPREKLGMTFPILLSYHRKGCFIIKGSDMYRRKYKPGFFLPATQTSKIWDKKAQSLIEYAVLLCLVISAILVMSAYIKRAYSGRIRADADSISSRLYSPKHTASKIETTSTTISESCTGTNCQGVSVPYGVTAEWTNSDTIFDQKEAVDSFSEEE